MLIRDLFASDVTRDIPPVVYFHEQSPPKLADEVSEYIITGGWPEGHPNRRRVPDGIHEQYVRLLSNIAGALDRKGGPELPNVWISGFYGSGKSSFAKLLGLALDGIKLPDGRTLDQALLQRDTSPRASELREAWQTLRAKIDPISVVFDVGGVARDNEHIHSVVMTRVQQRLGYCSTEPLVADFELKLERDGEWDRFQQVAQETLGEPWFTVKDNALAEEQFSLVLSVMYPELYTDPMSWFMSRAGTHTRSESPEAVAAAIRDMLGFRKPGATLFVVVDEVSQYVLASKDRVDKLRVFATALGSSLKGRAWLMALGQQKLDEDADDSFLVWAKDRFPPRLRVHLANTNIRDVVHKRLLHKNSEGDALLRGLFEKHRAKLKLYAYGCEDVSPDEFVDVYPLLPGHIDLLLEITTALRTRSTRSQGDDQAIRGLLQLLGELFRSQKLAELPVGALVTLDQVYEVQHTALDSDTQASMARILSKCADDESGLLVRVAKAVALLELIQERMPTDAKLVARCLYARVDQGNREAEITDALETLRRRNLLGYTEKLGYKIQSTAGEEWERERRDMGVSREVISGLIQDALKGLGATDRPKLQGRPFLWAGVFSDGRRVDDATLVDPRDAAVVRVDYRYVVKDERTPAAWVRRSAETALKDRLIWVCGETDEIERQARELVRSRAMVAKYEPRNAHLSLALRLLLQSEKSRVEELQRRLRDAVSESWMGGALYYQGRPMAPADFGASFRLAQKNAAERILPELFPYFTPTNVDPSELLQLVEPELSGISPKFMEADLGIFGLDGGRYAPECGGAVPRRIQSFVEEAGSVSGTALLAHFGGPPNGYTVNVIKACVAGLLRAGKVRVQTDTGVELTAIRDAGVKELIEKDRSFRRATLYPAGEDDIGFSARQKICKFFKKELELAVDREDHAIADAVALRFPELAADLRGVLSRLNLLPGTAAVPGELRALEGILDQCVRTCRQTRPTVRLVKQHLDALRDGVRRLKLYDAELTDAAIGAVRAAVNFRDHLLQQLERAGALDDALRGAAERLREHLKTPRPWLDIAALDADLEAIRAAYTAERGRLIGWQQQQADQAREQVKGRVGFEKLSPEQRNHVLRPIREAQTDTAAEDTSPSLITLKDPFLAALHRAVDESNARLDAILSEGDEPLIRTVNLKLRNRELTTAAEVDALLDEIRTRLMEHIAAKARVRLV